MREVVDVDIVTSATSREVQQACALAWRRQNKSHDNTKGCGLQL